MREEEKYLCWQHVTNDYHCGDTFFFHMHAWICNYFSSILLFFPQKNTRTCTLSGHAYVMYVHVHVRICMTAHNYMYVQSFGHVYTSKRKFLLLSPPHTVYWLLYVACYWQWSPVTCQICQWLSKKQSWLYKWLPRAILATNFICLHKGPTYNYTEWLPLF